MVDGVVGAELARLIQLVFIAGGGDHPAAPHELGDLDSRRTNARAAAQPPTPCPPGFGLAERDQHVPCGKED